MKTNQPDSFWTASCQGVFGGHGMFATGKTRQEAGDALWKGYSNVSSTWSSDGDPRHSTLQELERWWGVKYRECILGEAYFGDDGAGDAPSNDQVRLIIRE